MEAMDLIWAASRDLSYVFMNHPVYSVIGSFVLGISLLRFYCRLTCGMCDSDQDMTGKTVLITGASAGIGKATALDLARRNARVIMACRNESKAQRVADEIISSTGNSNVIVKILDLSSFDSVRRCAEDVLRTEDKLHVLINNAGILDAEEKYTRDNCEMLLQVNHFSHFLLTLMLLDLLKKSAPSRIINVSSKAYEHGKFDPNDLMGKKSSGGLFSLYSRSKLANILFTRELASRLKNTGVTVNALHPGAVLTDIMLNMGFISRTLLRANMYWLGKSIEEGAQTSIYLAVHPNLEYVTGKYFSDCKEQKLEDFAKDDALAKTLFELSEDIVGMKFR